MSLKDEIKHQLSQYNPDELYDVLVEKYKFKQESKNMKAGSKTTIAQIQSELRKYEQAKLKMEGHETKLNAYLKSKIVNDDKDFYFNNDEVALSDLAGDGLCLMFGVHGMSINTAIRKIKEDGHIYTSKITNVDLSF